MLTVTCWSCGRTVPREEAAPVGFLAVYLCRRCEDKHYEARNKINLKAWEDGFRLLARQQSAIDSEPRSN